MRIAVALLAGSVLFSINPIAQAQTAEPAPTDLEQRLRVVERKLENEADEAQAKAKDTSTASATDKGFGIKSGDGAFELKIRGLLQADGRFFIGDPAGLALNDTFLFRRIEPIFEATLGKLVYFKLQPQFAGDTASTADAYGELRFAPALAVRVGKFKEPLSLENLQPASAIEFMERGAPTELAGNRDLGLQLQGELLGGAMTYALGVVNGAPDGRDAVASDIDNRKEGVARLFFEPIQGLGFGIAGSTGTKLTTAGNTNLTANATSFNAALPRYRSPGQNIVFSYRAETTTAASGTANTVVAKGTHTRYSPQLYFYRGGFGLIGEYISSKQEVARAGVAGEFENKAYQGVGSYVLTGEAASYKGVKPSHPWISGGEGLGALEVALRYSVLDIDDAAFAGGAASFADPAKSVSKARDTGVALNWYVTANARISLDYDTTKFTDGAGTTATPTDRAREKALFTRLQFSF